MGCHDPLRAGEDTLVFYGNILTDIPGVWFANVLKIVNSIN